MSENKRLSERNAKIALMLSDGEQLKNFYRFIAQNPYINLHDACQIVIERPDATVCNSMEEWNALGRRVTKGRKAISYYDHDGYKQFVFDAADTHGEERYQRPIFPLKRMLIGLDELNGTALYDDLRGDYRKIHNGVYTYLEKSGALTGDEQHDNLLSEGVAFSLYCKTGFPKTIGIHIHGLPYSYRENAEFVKEMYIQSELLAEEIDEAYEGKLQEVKVIDDTEEETVTDEPIIRGGDVEQTKEPLTEETEELPEQGNEVSVSPIYRQYLEAQMANPKVVVLLRVGDFYEIMGENARTVAEELDLTLTSREVGLPERVPMCGFPYYASDAYIEKILAHHSVLLAEDGQEPKYILSHAEALRAEQAKISEEPEQESLSEIVERDEDEIAELQELFSEEEEKVKDPELIPIDDESTPFDDEEEEQSDEEADDGFEDEEDFEEESEQEETENKPKPTRKKEEKGIKDRPRKQKPQLSLFDLMEPQEKSEQELLIERSLKYGSGFQHGKYRIFDKYNENPTAKAFADFLKREYGIGGRGGWGGDNEQHDGKGIRLSHCDENGKTLVEAFLKWPEAATRIADLIDDDNYLTEQEKAGYVEYRAEQNRQKELRAEEERQKREIIELAIVSEQPARKQRILDEYSKTTKIEDFAKFLRDEYGTAVETTSKYHARYDANGVFISKYNAIGNTELRVSLSWNNFAERVCDVIEAERLFAPEDAEFNAGFVDQMVKLGTQNTESGKYAYHFATFGKDEGYVRAHCDEIKEMMLSRVEVKDVQSDEWYIHATFYKDYCAKLQGTEEARQEHKERITEIADKIIEEGTKNTTEGNYIHFFEEFGKHAEFAKNNAEEIAEELSKHEEVSDVELTPDSFDTNFYLDYCPNYIPKEEEDVYEEYIKSFEEENKPSKIKATFNRFKDLSDNDKAFIERYSLRAHREPSMSPWDEVQQCETIAEGIYSVSTAGHGGIMIAEELAPYVLSPEALSEGMREGGYYCYEEDALQCIPLRELYDKGILNDEHSYFKAYHVKTEENGRIPFSSATAEEKKRFIAEWNDSVNESLATWNKEYWKKYQEAEQNQKDSKNTDLTDILDQTELGGAKTRFRNNVAAIRLVNRLYAENRNPTTEERKTLSRFVGWGGLSQAFDEKNPDWQKEYAELKGLLSAEDYDNARGSTLNAYYTPKEVIDGIYKALDRFGVKGNNRILEPSMGTGNFFGYMPKEVADGSRLYGVELDNLTGRIAAKLYPQANVQIKGFEDTTFPNDKFDIVVGNVPFGGYGVADSDYNRYNFKVHDYFLAKSVDKVKPGGIVAVVTSKGTMDKLNANARKYVAERAELLGAIRLPNTAFKQTAGTEAVADILFFRKREEKITDLSAETWLATGKTEEGYEINQYFIDHPGMVLGTLKEEQGLYGGIDTTVKPDGRDLKDALAEAIQNLPQSFYQNPETSPAEEQTTEVDYNVKPLCYKAENGRLYMRIGDEMVEQAIPKSPKDAYQRIQGMIGLREELHHILDIQIAGCSDEVLKKEQAKLNAQYDLFVRRYGNLNSQTNTKLFKDDGDSALLFSCEDVDEETKAVTKSDVFSKRTIRPYVVPTSTDDPFEALQISKNERGKVDIAYIEELTGKDYDTVVSELGNSVFRDPEIVDENDKYSGFISAEEYLSGQVVSKLDLARSVAAEHPEYRKNVDALEAVQPQKLTASEISVRLGATWIDKEYYKKFYCELLGVYWYLESDIELFYNPHDSSWRLDQKENVRNSTYMRQREVYGTKRAPAYRLFIDAMNLRATTIYDTIEEDGKEKRVVNHAETIAAREKQNKIKEEFINWIFKTPERREELEATYNRLFNRTRLPSYDGSYLKFPEMNPAIELKPHQKNAVHRIITGNSSTLLHHVVGAGKTFTVVASIMKLNLDKREEVIVDDDGEGDEENYRAIPILPEERLKKEVSIIDEEDKIAAMEVDILPDYAVTKEDMHAYGYTWDGILPVTGITAKALARIGVTIYELRENDTEGMVDDPAVFDEKDRLFGVEKPEWNAFMRSENGRNYMATRREIVKSVLTSLDGEDMSYFSNTERETLWEQHGMEVYALDKAFGGRAMPSAAEMKEYALSVFDEQVEKLKEELPFADHGWSEADIHLAVFGNVEAQELKDILSKYSYETRLNAFLDKELAEFKYLNGRVTGFTADEIFDISNDLKPSFEGSEFAENLTGNDYDDWYDIFQEDELIPLLNQRALPGETYALDETEENPLLPDYTVSDEDMHDYGYMKDEMIPLHKRAAQRLWGFGLEINILSHDNTEKAVERFSELTPTERTLYGIRKEVWMNYLNNEKTSPYLWARKEFCTAASDVMQKELDYVDEGFTINFIETNFAERVALEQYLADKERPDPKVLTAFVPQLLDEFSSRMWSGAFREYGWEESDLTRAIAEHLTNPVMQKIAVMNSVKDNFGRKEIDYEAEVIKSVNTEFEVYKADVLSRSPEDIFYENYKIHVFTELKDVIDTGTENGYLEKEHYRALYEDRGSILTELYDDFIGDEYASLNTGTDTAEFIKDYCEHYHADAMTEKEQGTIYLNTAQYSVEHDEIEQYRISHRQSEECREAIDKAISENFDGMRLKDGFIPELIDKFGMERVQYILATTIRENLGDGRYSLENKGWAENIAVSESQDERRNCCLRSHPAVIDGVVNSFKKYMRYNDFLDEVTNDKQNDNKEEKEELAESKFLKQTSRGDKVVSITQDKNGRDIAVVQRKNDYTVAIGYDTTDGTWAQGVYDFKDEKAANEYREKYYGENVEPQEKWYAVYVSRDALIKTYDKSSLMRMPSSNKEYADYTYFMYNNRIKNSRQLVDMQSDSRELCYKLMLAEGEVVNLRNRDGDEVELTAEEFAAIVNHTSDKDYVREQKAKTIITLPREAVLGNYEKATLFKAPSGTEFAGYSYYLPNSVIGEDTKNEDGRIRVALSEDFKIKLNKGSGEKEITVSEYAALVNGTTAESYKRERSAEEENREEKADEKKWTEIPVSEEAVIATYEKSTLFKMPKGKYEGLVYYIPSGMVRKDEKGIRLRLPEDFEVHLKDKSADENIDIKPDELEKELKDKGDDAYENLYRRPSEEVKQKFDKVEQQLRTCLPAEMKDKPNWVIVRTRENADTGRLDKFLISPVTGKFAESDNPETWTDFDTACKYARGNGGVALAYALDGKDGIACIDLDHCVGEDGKRSALADEVLSKCGKTYIESSVSGKGIHVFGKTDGMDLRSFSKDGDMEFYQDNHFIAMTGDGAGYYNLESFDTPEMKSLLERKLERRTEWKNVGKGMSGLSQMDDRELLEKAFSAKNGDTVKRLYNGEDLRNNHSNSDMSLMNYLAFYSGGNVEQMTRIFATSGLYRPEKAQSYYEYTAIKAAKDTPHYTPPKAPTSAPKSSGSGNGKA